MTELLTENSFFFLLLTLAAYQAGLWLQRKLGWAVCNPILIAALLVGGVLVAADIPYTTYQTGCAALSWLLTPATVCLAIPLYTQLRVLRKNWRAILAGVAAGTAASLGSIAVMACLFGLDHTLYISLLPKSITTAMGLALSEMYGGIAGVTTAAIIVTGIFGNCCGTWLCRLFRLQDPVAQGVAFGTASHVIGTARAASISPVAEAVSSLSLVIAGLLTAVAFPPLASLL